MVTNLQTSEGNKEMWTYFPSMINTEVGDSADVSHTIMFNDQDIVIGVTTTKNRNNLTLPGETEVP